MGSIDIVLSAMTLINKARRLDYTSPISRSQALMILAM